MPISGKPEIGGPPHPSRRPPSLRFGGLLRMRRIEHLPFTAPATFFHLHRLEADLEPVSGRLGETRERARRRLAEPAFQPRDRALRRVHALGEFGLAQTGA